MHSWRAMLDTLDAVDRPNIGFQADMSHTFLYLLGYNAPQDRILPEDFKWEDREALTAGLKKLTSALRPWTIDFHVAQNDGTVFGSGSHDKTGRHCLATDPNGKIDRSDEHTSELQSLMRISYAVFCLKKKTTTNKRESKHKPQRTTH